MIYIVLITKALLETSILVSIYLIIVLVGIFVVGKLQLYYKNRQIKKRDKKWQKEHEEFMQRQRRWESMWKLHKDEMKKQQKEKEKYPLFFLKKGIV